jgi:hypothetical protein
MRRLFSHRLQFSLATLLTLMLIASFLLASYGGVLREIDHQGSMAFLISLVLLIAAPLALVIAISTLRSASEAWSRFRFRKRRP